MCFSITTTNQTKVRQTHQCLLKYAWLHVSTLIGSASGHLIEPSHWNTAYAIGIPLMFTNNWSNPRITSISLLVLFHKALCSFLLYKTDACPHNINLAIDSVVKPSKSFHFHYIKHNYSWNLTDLGKDGNVVLKCVIPIVLSQILQCIMCICLHIHAVRSLPIGSNNNLMMAHL